MSNPMLQVLNQNGLMQIKSNVERVKQIMGAYRNGISPQGAINGVLMQNPQMRRVIQYVKENGGDAQKVFYDMARQKGIDPQEVLDMLK